MRRALLPVLALLAACAPRAPEPTPPPTFRDRAAPIGSSLRGTALDYAGEWVVSAAFPGGAVGPGDRITIGQGAWVVDGRRLALAEAEAGAGRWAGDADLWSLWVDDDFRTAVIGSPDGTVGWIMDRPGAASPDRPRAAREMLDFNGYDVARLSG